EYCDQPDPLLTQLRRAPQGEAPFVDAIVPFFFFQAEDGIRDDLVTGVQTCALPISNTCTGATLQPGRTCTVGVRFSNVTSAVNVTRTGTITFTDNATGSPQSFPLSGLATP